MTSRAQRRWIAAAESEYRRAAPGEATDVVVEAGPGQLRRARWILRVTNRDFARVVSRRGELVCVVPNFDGPFLTARAERVRLIRRVDGAT